MGADVVTVAYGPDARHVLARAVGHAKEHDPLAPVTVVVTANSVGVATRRDLAAELGAVIGVQFLTVYRLAELLGAARLAAAGRRPVSTAVLAAGLRGVLADRPGGFALVRDHAATEEALVATHRRLSDCSADALDAISRCGPRAHDVVRIHREVRARLHDQWFEERDLMDAATDAIETGEPGVGQLGTTIVYLPQALTPPARRLLRALADATKVIVVAGTTGSERADLAVFEAVGALAAPAPIQTFPTSRPEPQAVRSHADADDEARAAVRDVVAALHRGVPADRVAVLYGAREPYARLLHEHFTASGIATNGPALRPIAQSMAGRFVLRLLALAERDFARADVFTWMTSAAVRWRGTRVATARWEAVSRRAGVLRGGDWSPRLRHYADSMRADAETLEAAPEFGGLARRQARLAADADALEAFVRQLRRTVTPDARAWADHVRIVRELVDTHLGGDAVRSRWPDWEQRAAQRLDAVLEQLAALDAVESVTPSLAVFRRTLELELDRDLGRAGRFGTGVLVAPVAFGLGLDLRELVVVGLAEGVYPPRRSNDALLHDDERDAAGGELPLVADGVHDDERALLAAMAGAQRVTLTWSRGDLRRTSDVEVSRFVTDADLGTDVTIRHVPSAYASITTAGPVTSAQEHHVRELAATGSCADPDGTHASALACVTARRSDRFTRFDGNVARVAALVPGPCRDAIVVSPTALAAWAANPFEYFVDRVLGAEIPEEPEDRVQMSAADSGVLVHRCLEEWLLERLAHSLPAPDAPWPAADRQRLRDIAATVCADFAARGLAGRPVFWRRDRPRIERMLEQFLAADDERRAALGLTPFAAELAFGLARPGSIDDVAVTLADGRTVRFRGAADRIDVASDGTIHVVDYKTGKSDSYRNITEDDAVIAGTQLQLPVYAHAARAARGAPDAPVVATYWFTKPGERRFVELPLTASVLGQFDDAVREIVDGIEAGWFPCAPPEQSFFRRRSHSDPDALGTRELARAWERKRDDAVEAVSR